MPHIHELYDLTITAFIVHDGKVLLVNHPRYEMWLPVGGHVELDEDPEQALYREIEEESGLEVKILSDEPPVKANDRKFIPTPAYVDVHDANPPHKHINLVYFARALSNKHVLTAEHTDMRWLTPADLEKPEYKLSKSLKFYCREALKAAKT